MNKNSEKNFILKQINFDDPHNKQQLNDKLFQIVAPSYNTLTRFLSFGLDQSWKKKLINQFKPMTSPNCLDIACGTGDITQLLAQKYPGGTIIGLDLNEKMLELAAQKNEYLNITFSKGSMNQLNYNNLNFDLVSGGYALRNAPDLKKTLTEIHRILKKGGQAVFLDFSKTRLKFLLPLQLFLLKFWGSVWGFIFHCNPDIYAYIAESLKKFPGQENLVQLLQEIGFTNIKLKKLCFGFVALISFEK